MLPKRHLKPVIENDILMESSIREFVRKRLLRILPG